MVRYQVNVGDEAIEALQAIHSWLKENESITIANKVRDGILDEIDGLAEMPQKHAIAQEITNDQILYRRVLKWSYRVIFTIDEDEVEVLVVDIVHTRQNPQKLQDKFGG